MGSTEHGLIDTRRISYFVREAQSLAPRTLWYSIVERVEPSPLRCAAKSPGFFPCDLRQGHEGRHRHRAWSDPQGSWPSDDAPATPDRGEDT